MQRSYLLLIALIILIGCKPRSESNSRFNLPDVGDIKNKSNNSNSGTSGEWSSDYRSKMEQRMRFYAAKMVENSSQRNDFINCVISSLEAKFPNENVDTQSAEAQAILKNCASNHSGNQTNNDSFNKGWSNEYIESKQRQLRDYAAEQGMQGSQVNDFSNCVISTIQAKYPDEKNVPDDTPEILAILKDCQKQIIK